MIRWSSSGKADAIMTSDLASWRRMCVDERSGPQMHGHTTFLEPSLWYALNKTKKNFALGKIATWLLICSPEIGMCFSTGK